MHMICPRCSHEWAGGQGTCPRCGFHVRVSTPLEAPFPDPSQQFMTQSGDFFAAQKQEPFPTSQGTFPRNPVSQTDALRRKSSSDAGMTEQKSSSGGLSGSSRSPLPGTRPMSGNLSRPLSAPRSLSGSLPSAGSTRGTGPTAGGQRAGQSAPADWSSGASRPITRPTGGETPATSAARPITRPTGGETPAASAARQTRSAPLSAAVARTDQPTVASASRPLLPGTVLRDGRYRLQDLLERQDWQPGVFEAFWNGRDLRRGGVPVTICEVVVPDLGMLSRHANLAGATRALAASGRDPHIATLLEAFSDQGRSFFVFELVEGDSLLTHLRRLGQPLPEAEVAEMCLQICDALDLLSRQSPALTHGLIRPEHIYLQRNGGQYTLANFSPLVVIGATSLISGGDRARLSPYTPPDFPGGKIDVRSDLYSLLATAYHAITGNAPLPTNMTIPRAKQLNPAISARFDAILAKGLHPVPQQRYQTPFDLRQDLLALRTAEGQMRSERSSAGSVARGGVARERPPVSSLTGAGEPAFALPLQIAPLPADPLKTASALPEADELPPLSEGHNYLPYLEAAILLIGFFVMAILSNYHG